MNNAPLKFFVDAQRPDGLWVLGEIACTRAEAETRAGEVKFQHPDWVVEINPVLRTASHAFPELPTPEALPMPPMALATTA